VEYRSKKLEQKSRISIFEFIAELSKIIISTNHFYLLASNTIEVIYTTATLPSHKEKRKEDDRLPTARTLASDFNFIRFKKKKRKLRRHNIVKSLMIEILR
jgi:hypothetical protein